MRFAKFLENDFDDFFKDLFNTPQKKVLNKKEQIVYKTLPLYRGFDADLNTIKTEGNFYILSPERAEQGMLWFTHPYIRGYNPIEYAKNHGEWFMTYHLVVKKHVEVEHYEDGSTYEGIPDYFNKLTAPTENSRYFMGIELPEGWVFSYKMEKFIGCKIKIKVRKDQVVPSDAVTV